MRRVRRWYVVAVVSVAVLATSCATEATPTSSSSVIFSYLQGEAPPTPPVDQTLADEGAALYGKLCASCHGADLSGEPDWMQRNDDGSWRAPPHDASGHTWHHSDALLLDVIGNGGVEGSTMPAYADVLTDTEMSAIIEFFRSSWGQRERDFQWQVTWQDQQRSQRAGGG